ncbi:MAG: MMPL family transporter [Thermodesulfobacteriota bacterium]
MMPQKKKRSLIILTGIFILLCLLGTVHLNVNETIIPMLPDSEPMAEDFQFIMKNIPASEALYIDIQDLSDEKNQLENAADAFYAKIRESSFFRDIIYRFSYDEYLNLVALVQKNKAGLLDEEDLAVIKERLTPRNITTRVSDIKRRLLDPAAMLTADDPIRDPIGMEKMIVSKLDDFKSGTYRMKIQGSRIFSKNSDHILMMATPAFPAVETHKSGNMMQFLQDVAQRVIKDHDNNIRIGFSGTHVATLDNAITIQKDVKKSVTALSLGIVVIGILFFKRRIHAVLVFLPTLFSLCFATVLMTLFYRDISAIALGCGAVLIGITVDFGIHVLFGVDAGGSTSPKTVATNLRRPVFAGACTTMAAFSILLFSSLPGQRQMGAFAIIGIGTAAFFACFLLHNFIPRTEPQNKTPFIDLVRICYGLRILIKKHTRLIAVVGFIILLAGAAGIRSFEFDGDVTRLNHLQPRAQADMDRFLETWGGSSPSLLLVQARTEEQALQKNDRLYAVLEQMQDQGLLEQIASLSRILPSLEQRQINRGQFRDLFRPETIERIAQNFETAAREAGFKTQTFQPFVDSLMITPDTLSSTAFNSTVIEKMIKAKIIHQDGAVMILTSLKVPDKKAIPQILDILKKQMPDTMFLDKPYFIERITRLVAKEFRLFFLSAAAAMMVVVTIFYRNLKIAAIIVAPVFCAAFITAGLLGFLKIPINLISMIFIVFVFGIGVDFSIFLANHELQGTQENRNVAAGGVVLCALTTMGAFLTLVFAKHEALHSIGVAGLSGMVCSLVLALILIPTLMDRFNTKDDIRRLNGKFTV